MLIGQRILAGIHLLLLLSDWLSLFLLPRARRSFGPVEPPLLALTIFRIIVTGAVGIATGWAIWPIALSQSMILAVTTYGLWVEPFRLGVTYETLRSPKLDSTLPPIRLLHLADLHIERLSIREERLQHLVSELAPDVIVFSGDFVNLSNRDDPTAHEIIREIIATWKAPSGVYVVSGSPLVESQEMVRQFVDGLKVHWLQDRHTEIDIHGHKVSLIGVTCHHEVESDSQRLDEVMRTIPSELLHVLVYHSPDIAPQASRLGIDLYLCGHTHGGQIRLPGYGALVTSSAWGKRFEMGRYTVGSMTLYTSRGIGMEGAGAPRARFLCPPEITLWTITGSD